MDNLRNYFHHLLYDTNNALNGCNNLPENKHISANDYYNLQNNRHHLINNMFSLANNHHHLPGYLHYPIIF